MFLNITLTSPEGVQTYQRTLADRIGTAARANGGSVSVSSDPNAAPLISPLDLATLSITPSQYSPAALTAQLPALDALEQQLINYQSQVAATPAGTAQDALEGEADDQLRQSFIAMARSRLAQFDIMSDSVTGTVETASGVLAYLDSPRITILSSNVSVAPDGSSTLEFSTDLLKDDIRAIASPGNAAAAIIAFNLNRGLSESDLEASALGTPPPLPGTTVTVSGATSAATIFEAALAQGISLVVVASGLLPSLDGLNLPADAKALISSAVNAGKVVIVPSAMVSVGGQQTIAWYEIDPATGNTVGVLQSGQHQALVEYNAARFAAEQETKAAAFGLGVITGLSVNTFKNIAIFLFKVALNQVLPSQITALKQIWSVATKMDAIIAAILDLPFAASLPFAAGFLLGLTLGGALATDPPVAGYLSDPNFHILPPPPNQAQTSLTVASSVSAGAVQANLALPSIQATGQLSATWSSQATSGFSATSVAAFATVVDGSGKTVGTGTVSLAQGTTAALAVGGNVSYVVNGSGTLALYGPAETTLGVSGDWDSYQATLSGAVALKLTTDGLILNGAAVPAGTYTILTGSAVLNGTGATSSPTFAGSVVVNATSATLNLGASAGNVSIAGRSLGNGSGMTMTGYTGAIGAFANGNGTDQVGLGGNATGVVLAGSTAAALSTDQNTSVSFTPVVATSLSDSYTMTAAAPAGWTLAIDATGKVTVTPAPGTQSGKFPIDVTVQSTSNPDLVAQTIVNVAITATQPGISLSVNPDTRFTVPFNGAQLPSAFQASIKNLGPATDTYNLTFASVTTGFTLANSGTSVTVPAGQTGILGLYLEPNAGQSLPAPGTVLSFQVTATSSTTPTITQTQTVTFTVPTIHALALTASPATVSTAPGVAATTTITITDVGNVAENNIALAASQAVATVLSGPATLSLGIGQSTTETLTLTPAASAPLNSIINETVSATLGTTGSIQSLLIPVDVVVPGAAAIASASVAADVLGNTGLADRLDDLSTALTNLEQNPTSAVYQGQAVADLESLISQFPSDPFLVNFTASLTAAQSALGAATTPAQIQNAISNLGTALGSLALTINDEAAHRFTISLSPDREIVEPNAPEVFDILLTNNGTAATTYDIGVSGLPAGVNASLSEMSVTLQPGQALNTNGDPLVLTLTEPGSTLVAANFTVTATAEGAPEITQAVPGVLTLRNASVSIGTIVVTPPFTNAGGAVDVTAKIQSAVNTPAQGTAAFTVTDSAGNVLFTSTPVPFSLTVGSTLTSVDLGSLDTTGFANGVDTITVTLSGLPGFADSSLQTSLLIGQPVTASLSTSPSVLAVGTGTVTNTLTVTTQSTFPAPLSLQGAVATPAPGTSVAIFQSGNTTYAYESGTGGIDIVNVTDPTNPQLVGVFGQNDIVNGQFGFNVAKIVNGELLVGTSNGNNGSVFNLLVYSLTDPTAPQLESNTTINYRFLSDMLVNSTGTDVFVPTNGFFHFGSSISQLFGDLVSVDLTDPTAPALAGSLFNNEGQPDGGDASQYGGTLVNDNTAYIAGLTPGGNNISSNTGNLLVVNVSDPTNMSVITSLTIPGTINLLDVAVHGNRALVLGTAGTEPTTYDANATGVFNNLTLTVLDISDVSNPKILGTTLVTPEQFPVNEAGAKTDVVDLNNGDFAVSDTDANGNPALLVVDPSDPNNIVVGAAQVPSGVHGITVLGDLLYASTASGLSIYHIDPLLSEPVTVTVSLPAGAAATIVPGSFSVPPSQINTSASGDSLVWTRAFAAGNTTYNFTWQSTLSGIVAGQAQPVTTGTTVSYVNEGTPGSLSLPGTAVSGVSIIGLTPVSQTEQPGGSATFDIRLANPTSAPVTYSLTVQGLPFYVDSSINFASETVAANGTMDLPLVLTSESQFAQLGDVPFSVSASYAAFAADNRTEITDVNESASGTLTLAGPAIPAPDTTAHGVVVQLTPTQAVLSPGTPATYVVRVTNVGSADDHFDLAVNGLPGDVLGTFQQGASFLDVAPGAGNFRDVFLTLSSTDQSASPATIPFTVTATESDNPLVSGSAGGTAITTANGVQVFLSPGSNAPGGSFQMTVINTGTVADTFNLALGGPAALVAKLAQASVTLAPGASQTIPITTTAAPSDTSGDLNLVALASSEANPAIVSGETAVLDIPSTSGLSTSLTPASQVLPQTGLATFILNVDNTGNSEDNYTVRIVGTNGPVSATLVGLDGTSAQMIPILRLPGLTTGAVTLQVDLGSVGQGSVTVVITSNTDPSRSSMQTAVVSTTSSSAIATTTRLALVSGNSVAGQPETFQAVVVPSSGSSAVTGTMTFFIDGVAQLPVNLQVVSGVGAASFTTTALAAGVHQIFAFYAGAGGFLASPSNVVPVVISAAVNPSDGPSVTSVKRYGFHEMPTTIVLAFNQPLDPTSAQNARNYDVVTIGGPGRGGNRHGHVIAVKDAVYNPLTDTVTLSTAERLDIHNVYRLVVNGTRPGAVSDISGLALDGLAKGVPGSDFSTKITRKTLSGRAPTTAATVKIRKKAVTKTHHASVPKPVAVHGAKATTKATSAAGKKGK